MDFYTQINLLVVEALRPAVLWIHDLWTDCLNIVRIDSRVLFACYMSYNENFERVSTYFAIDLNRHSLSLVFRTQGSNIFGKTTKSTNTLQGCRHLNTLNISCLGHKTTSTMSNCFPLVQVRTYCSSYFLPHPPYACESKGVKFPREFRPTVRQLVKRLLRVYAHMYCHHYPVVVAMGLDIHMNTSFKHYVLFVREFSLDFGEGFYGPLEEMAEKIVRTV